MQDVPTHGSSPRYTALIVAGVLAAALAIQTTLWLTFPVADEGWWATDAAKVAAGTPLTPADITYVHPGTTILYPTAGLIYAGVGQKTALRLVMAVFAAICIAIVAAVAYRLRPRSLWWLAAALILIPDLRLLHGTPPSTAAALLSVVFVLLLLYAAARGRPGTYRAAVYLGICSGLLLATRFDTGAFVLVAALPLLAYMFRLRTFILLALTVFAAVAANPHAWADPLLYFSSIPQQIFSNTALVGISILVPFLLTFPFAILSVALSLVLIYRHYTHPAEDEMGIPFGIYAWFLGTTLLFTALLAPLSYHHVRYYMPFYLTWDILLPLSLIVLAPRFLPVPALPWLVGRRFEWTLVGLIVLISVVRLLILLTADTREIIL